MNIETNKGFNLKLKKMKNFDYLLFNICILFTGILGFMVFKVVEIFV